MKTLFTHCHVVSPGLDLPDASVLVEHGAISAVFHEVPVACGADETVDLGGHFLMPGFIDIHTHGAAGADVCDGSEEAIRTIAAHKLREGVTTFLPTTLTLPHEQLAAAARAVEAYRQRADFARAPGLHVEGPFINPKCTGAQNPAFVRPPDPAEIFALREITPVCVVSVATEMPGGVDFVRAMSEAGIATSLAHTAATFADFQAARAAGLKHLTHFCNQMTPLHHREIGIVGAGLVDRGVMIELICDTIHLCPDMIRLVFATKDVGKLMLITDSMAASWMGDGTVTLGGLDVVVRDGAARLASGALAGSTLRYNDGLRNVARLTERPLAELVQTTSLNQAKSLGLGGLGKIEEGFTADFVRLDEALNVVSTWVGGVARG